MQSFSSRMAQDVQKFFPDVSTLPKSSFLKGVLFVLGIFGFATMFLQPTIAQDGLTVQTSLTNSVMSVWTLKVNDWSRDIVVLNNGGIQLNTGGTAATLLKVNGDRYIIPAPLVSGDIAPQIITTEKIADGTITCPDLTWSLYSLLCSGNPNISLKCPTASSPWNYFVGIDDNGQVVCAGASSGIVLPTCTNWETIVWDSVYSKWACKTIWSWESLWEIEESLIWLPTNNIYNKNLTGKVGVGITSNIPSTLTVGGDFLVKGNGVPAVGGGLAPADPTAILYASTGGKVGILTRNPQYELDVVWNIRAAQYIQNSDARLKINVLPITDALQKLLGINGYTYNLLSDNSFHYGVIAQEVEKFFPHLVSTDDNGLKSVNYNGLIAPMIESIKTLNSKIDTLEAQLHSNTTRIEALEKLQK